MAKMTHQVDHEINYGYLSIPAFLQGMFPSADLKEDCHSIFADNENIPEFCEIADDIGLIQEYLAHLISADIPFVASLDHTNEYTETIYCNINKECALESRSHNSMDELKEIIAEYTKFSEGKQTQFVTESNVAEIRDKGPIGFYLDEEFLTNSVEKIKAQFNMLGGNPKALLEARSIT